MRKPKVVINTELNFNDGLKEELQGYLTDGILEEYGIPNYWFERGTVKLKPGDIVAIRYADGGELYCEIMMAATTKDGQQMVHMRYKDFLGSIKQKKENDKA